MMPKSYPLNLAKFFLLGGACIASAAAQAQTPPDPKDVPDFAAPLRQQIERDKILTPQRLPEAQRPPVPEAQPETGPAVPDGQLFTVKRFDIRGNTLISTEDIQAVLAPWLNQAISLNELRRGVAQVAALYRLRGYLAQATLPNQDITDGVVIIQVIEGKVGAINIIAPPNVRQIGDLLVDRVKTLLEKRLPSGEPINLNDLDWALLVADDLPGVAVRGALQAGKELGTSDLVITLEPTKLIRGLVSGDNSGSRKTGSKRALTLVQLDSAFGWAEQLNISASKTDGSDFVRLGANWPIGSQGWNGWRMNAYKSYLKYQILQKYTEPNIKPDKGNSKTAGVGWQYPLVRSGVTSVLFDFGLENRESENITIIGPRKKVVNATTAGLSGSHFDGLWGGGTTTFSASITRGKLKISDEDGQFVEADQNGPNTRGNYTKVAASLSRLQLLTQQNTLFFAVSGQKSNKNLDESEQFYLGGPSSVRAYPSSELGGSEGLLASLELRRDLDVKTQVAAFYDHGWIWKYKNSDNADGSGSMLGDRKNRESLRGYGFYVSHRDPSGVEVKLTVSQRDGSNPAVTEDGTDTDGTKKLNRVWFSTSYSF